MLFNTMQYILFLPIVVLVYYSLPQKLRYVWLLGASYYFYMQWNLVYIILLLSCTLITYVGGLLLEKTKNAQLETEATRRHINKRKFCFIVCIVLNLGILGFFKYFSFAVSLLNRILSYVHIDGISLDYDILLPVGISFYTLQALGYLIDVYRGDIYAEHSFIRYALFVSFFPQLVAGPIERSKNLLVQLNRVHVFQYENIRKGMLFILYGLFLKMVIADRSAVIVDVVYENSGLYSGFYVIAATFFFAIQIYCDFYGYSTIARGSALLMGISLMDNFKAPYYSRSVKEFWRRWHISLSGWFRDYLYIPLGGSRKGKVRKEVNRMIVFAISGLWHGASLAFVLWGVLNGIYQVAEDVVERLKMRLDSKAVYRTVSFSQRLFQTAFTFLLVTFAWLFFRSGELEVSLEIVRNMCRLDNWVGILDGSLGTEILGGQNYMNVLLGSILVLFIVDYQKYKGKDVAEIFFRQGWWFRTMVIMCMIFVILLYGCYGVSYTAQQFIYFQF